MADGWYAYAGSHLIWGPKSVRYVGLLRTAYRTNIPGLDLVDQAGNAVVRRAAFGTLQSAV